MSFRVAVVGAGRMGKLHARIISEMDRAELVCVVDANEATAQAVARQRNCEAMTQVRDAVDRVDAAIIAVPTRYHLEAARPFVEAGKHVLIEKPYTNDVKGGEALIALARSTGASVQIGHTERFNPAFVAVQKYAIAPKFIEAIRISPFTFRSADVGVVLDMMIHDLDLVLMMAGGELESADAVGVNVVGDHEDICNARLHFTSGCVANITASRVAIKTERKMRIFSEQAYVSVDYAKKVGVVIRKSDNLNIIQMAHDLDVEDLAELAGQVNYTELVKYEELVVDDSNEPLRSQAEAFRRTVEENVAPIVTAEAGLAAVRCAHAILESVQAHHWDGEHSPRKGLGVIRRG
jgi:predicted dehydrogenase